MEASVGAAPVRFVGDKEGSERLALARRVSRRISVSMTLAHGLGGLDVFLLAFFVLPQPRGVDASQLLMPNLVAGLVYFVLATLIGMYFGERAGPAHSGWIREQRDPTPQERDELLRLPMRCLMMDGLLWLGGLVLFVVINAQESEQLAKHVGTTVLLGGITTCAIAYLIIERMLRPVTEIALEAGPPARPTWPGVEGRIVFAWVSATGAPLLGVVLVGLHALIEKDSLEDVAVSVVVLGVAAIVVGLGFIIVAARTVSAPLTQLRRAQARVEGGDLGAELRVADGSEVGVLQSGFNRMVAGLRERERLRDLYSRQVGEHVAQEALDGDPRLGGAERDVAVLFVDVIGSTRMSAHMSPAAVVDRLNRFFAAVVEVTGAHGGWVNKFEGDAALCVFGAPAPLEDAEACALQAARALHERLCEMGVEAGIGVSAGSAVAGWVGAENRFEYTVIGDPVNEAARLCEMAKRRPERVLASAAVVERSHDGERACWQVGEEAVLRGRTAPTRIALPLPTG